MRKMFPEGEGIFSKLRNTGSKRYNIICEQLLVLLWLYEDIERERNNVRYDRTNERYYLVEEAWKRVWLRHYERVEFARQFYGPDGMELFLTVVESATTATMSGPWFARAGNCAAWIDTAPRRGSRFEAVFGTIHALMTQGRNYGRSVADVFFSPEDCFALDPVGDAYVHYWLLSLRWAGGLRQYFNRRKVDRYPTIRLISALLSQNGR